MKIKVLNIIKETMADGPGLRNSIYCSGCHHHCPGCHNPESWDFENGTDMDIEKLAQDMVSDKYIDGVTFSGGDPLYQVEGFTQLAKRIKELDNTKTIWCYTGFKYEDIKDIPKYKQFLQYIDVLVDGPFIQELRDTNLLFRGSSNQRILYFKNGEIDIERTVHIGTSHDFLFYLNFPNINRSVRYKS